MFPSPLEHNTFLQKYGDKCKKNRKIASQSKVKKNFKKPKTGLQQMDTWL